MDILKIIFVIVLCMPLLYFGITFAMRLVDNALANKGSSRPEVRRRRERRRAR
ncbi:MAG: hypothetical protein LBC58_04665 [Clostridiales Family XIII bacterium]|nr:hypothetical protein [Clostridiales Family XIII bacterium]